MSATLVHPVETTPPTAREYRCPSCGSFVGASTSTAGWGRFKCPERRCGKWVRVSFERGAPEPERALTG
jgi:tRNA(Ile2) C34 agmatinyltransferase TiaS